MSLRINNVRARLGRLVGYAETLDSDRLSSANTPVTPIKPVQPLSRRQTYQKMRAGQTAVESRVRKLSRLQSNEFAMPEPASAEIATLPTLAVVNAIAGDGDKPRAAKKIELRKTAMQLRIANARRQRKPLKGLVKPGHDHDALSDITGIPLADEVPRNDIPLDRGPIDPALAVSKTTSTLPYIVPQNSETARRSQVEKLFTY